LQANDKEGWGIMSTLLYPIRAVSKLTGISIDTLRAWERRYQAVTPRRDERRRLYTEGDVQRLHLLNAGVEKGHAIGRLAGLSDEELKVLIASSAMVGKDPEPAKAARSGEPSIELSSLMAAIERLDYAEAERELSLMAAVLSPRELVHRVAQPLLRQVGEAWREGHLGIAPGHMTSALLRNLLGAVVPLYRRTSPAAKLLFATPVGERHEFGILLSAMLAAGGGLGIVYLGADLPAEEIVIAARKTAPQAVVLGFIGANGTSEALRDLQVIARKLPPRIELWVGGAKTEVLANEINQTRALLIDDFEMLEQHLSRLGARF
jgi:DNA-binding transcriptional MerR regulator/methylmalonyl-CoA mutase cobalamin-binding subunit